MISLLMDDLNRKFCSADRVSFDSELQVSDDTNIALVPAGLYMSSSTILLELRYLCVEALVGRHLYRVTLLCSLHGLVRPPEEWEEGYWPRYSLGNARLAVGYIEFYY